ncbi:MAG: ATP-binding cassette domain-containing protein, partial [Candidatus Kapaibacterium sp.]
FSYDGEREIVHNLSFKVNKGETIAIVGATGAGKTSIINILLKFYDYKSGSVKIDGREINSINSSDLRNDIALVMQDVFLFRGNIKENITLNNDKVKEIEMKLAAETVGISDFVNSQSDGYNTTVQERGATLSVGQKQLISFARALAYNPKILILDEATSNVDTETEVQLQTAIDKLLYGRTSIVVAHRLSTIRKANRILVMHKGELKETGTHEQLIALNGIYSRLYHLQYKMKDDIKVANDDNKENLNLNLN